MNKLDIFVYFLFLLRFSSIFFGIVVSYHKKIISTHTNNGNIKEDEYHKTRVDKNTIIKKFIDFLFSILIAILIFILFRPGDKKGVALDFKTNILLKIAAITMMINADWDSFYVFLHPRVKKFEQT
jgi:hypothetical protein